MKKIPSLFKRDYEGTRQVFDEVVEGCEWVINGEGVATVKYDGTACLVRDGKLYKRYRLKEGKRKPPLWLHHDFDPAAQSGHGWLPVDSGTSDQWHREAWEYHNAYDTPLPDGTYELTGPAVQKNPYKLDSHMLWMHGSKELIDTDRSFDSIRQFLTTNLMEGIVWHHPDGRMTKIKAKDFGIQWPR